MPYQYHLNTDENHAAAARLLAERMKWLPPDYPPMIGGVFDGDYYWVFTE